MIRLACESDSPTICTHEAQVRICGLYLAYGLDTSFLQFYTDGEGRLLSIMDGVGIYYGDAMPDEWVTFLTMNPSIQTIHTSANLATELANANVWQIDREGVVMVYNGPDTDAPKDPRINTSPYLPDVYRLLEHHFPGISPLDYWYPDVSHRIRHGNCHICVIQEGDMVVSSAMTVAETTTAAILGQIATHPDFRRMGLAQTCIKSVISVCKDKSLYILPINQYAQSMYEKMGFIPCDNWAECSRSK